MKYFIKLFGKMNLLIIFFLILITPIISQEVIATFGFGREFLNIDDSENNDSISGIKHGATFLFLRPSGFTVSAGTIEWPLLILSACNR